MNKRVWLIAGLLAGLNAPAWSQDLVLGLERRKGVLIRKQPAPIRR